MLTDFHETSITGIPLMRLSKWEVTTLCYLQNCMFCLISWPYVNRFSWDFYNRDSFDETIKMSGNNPVLTSKLHVLLNILASSWQIFMRPLYRNYFDEIIKMWGNNPIPSSKLHVLLNSLAPCWWIFVRLL